MKKLDGVGLENVKAVYSGPEGDLWELIMGEQIHVGGFVSSQALAEKAGIKAGMKGVDLCCCNGAGMRCLVKTRNVASMIGVDATPTVVERGKNRNARDGVADRISMMLKDVCDTGLPSGSADFVWGEDAWCYVVNKGALIKEAARIVKSGGVIAFTDWIEGSNPLTATEAQRYLSFMKFPSIEDLGSYRKLLADAGCEVMVAEDTGRFAPCVDLYLRMIGEQLTGDALRIIGYDTAMMEGLGGEMLFMQRLAHDGKIAQGRFVARKK